MFNTYGTNSSDLKLRNTSAILLRLLHRRTASRASLAHDIGVSNATVTNIVSELAENGIIEESGVRHEGQVGRPQREIRLIPSARYALGIHFDVGTIRIGIVGLLGMVLDSKTFKHSRTDDWQSVFKRIHTVTEQLLSQFERDRIVGIGVAASGLVDTETGINLISPNLNWHEVPMRDYLQDNLELPVIVENNVRTMAMSEAMFGDGRDADVLAFIYGRIGVGAGFVVRGNLFRGANSGAGEIGHTMLHLRDNTDELHQLEDLVSEPAIVQYINAECKTSFEKMQDIVSAATDNQQIRQCLSDRAFYLGVSLANLVNVLNPERIILGGIFAEAEDYMLPTVKRVIHDYAFAHLGENIKILTSRFGKNVGIIGASALALDHWFYRPQQPIELGTG